MHRDYRLYLDDILDAIKTVEEYTAGYNEEAFAQDRKTRDAVIRNLEIIGEAASKLPRQVKIMVPDIEWRKIVGLRNLLIHEYFGINIKIIWDIVESKLEPLKRSCLDIVKRLDNQASE